MKFDLTIFAQTFILILLLTCPLFAHAEKIDFDKGFLSEKEVDLIADKIKLVENSKHFPYGIKSINVNGNEAKARQICKNTIRNNFKRWQSTTKRLGFIEFLGLRYCPINDKADKTGLNKNWIRNLKKLLTE